MDTKKQETKIKPDILFPTLVVCVKFPDCAKVNEGLIKLARRLQEQDGKAKLNHNCSGKNTWQSMRTVHELKDPAMKEWVESLNSLLNDWAKEILEEEGFTLGIDSSWFNINPPGGENNPHIHPGSMWSGVYYVDKPEGSGNLQLYDPITQRHPLREPKNKTRKSMTSVQSETGGLIMFPAWLQHSVEVNPCKEDRISIAFNAVWRFTQNHSTKTYTYD